jgi:threonyl-tRNA synthetase
MRDEGAFLVYWPRKMTKRTTRRTIMQNEAQARSQQANVSVYPQFCGSWPNDEWPEDALIYQRGDFVDLCAGPHVEHEGAIRVSGLIGVEREGEPQ